MKQLKKKRCKYPKCSKETHSANALFCLEHSRKEKSMRKKAAVLTVSAISLVGLGFSALKKII